MAPKEDFSRPVQIGEIGVGGLEFAIEADADEQNLLATLLGVVTVNSLSGLAHVQRWRKGGAHLIVELNANIRQTCVATLEDFDSDFQCRIERHFADPRDKILTAIDEAELVVEPDGDDGPEPLSGPGFDVGHVIIEHLALILDPYPRRPEAEFVEHQEGPAKVSPFAALQALKNEKDQ